MAFAACPNCQATLKLPGETVASVRCPKCKTVFSTSQPSAPKPGSFGFGAAGKNPSTVAKPSSLPSNPQSTTKAKPGIDDDFQDDDARGQSQNKTRPRDDEDDVYNLDSRNERRSKYDDDNDEPVSSKKQRSKFDDDDDEYAAMTRKKQRKQYDDDDDEEDDDDRPRRNRKKGGKQDNKGLLIGAVIGGGVLLLVVVMGFGAYLISQAQSKSGSTSSNSTDSSNSSTPNSNSSTPNLLPTISPDEEFAGTWPEQGHGIGMKDVVVIHITQVEDKNTADTISEHIAEILPTQNRSYASSYRPPRMSVVIKPISNVEEFAKKIDFGIVVMIKGNLLCIRANKLEGPPTDPIERAFHDLKLENSSRHREALETLKTQLPESRRAEVLPLVESLTNHQDAFTREKAIEVYAAWATRDQVPMLIKILTREKSNQSAKFCAQALIFLKDERGIVPISTLLEHLSQREEAKNALISFGPAAEEAVINQLKNKDVFVREAACDILAKIGTKKCLPALQELAKGNDLRTKNAATKAIKEINSRE